jgi:DNA gyrase inhibitor GyrI
VGDEQQQVLIERSEVPVMFKRAAGDQAAITRVWAELEEAVGSLRGRKFYGVFAAREHEYRACVGLRDGDAPEALGLELGTLAGGAYVRVRIHGQPPEVYGLIAPMFERLAQRRDCDLRRPSVEFYRRRDVIDLLMPVC